MDLLQAFLMQTKFVNISAPNFNRISRTNALYHQITFSDQLAAQYLP